MSSQESQQIPLVYNREQEGLRLFELPPELVAALTSPHPPKLLLKSASATKDSSTFNPSHVVLCTPNQTYEVRQVQTSNQVYIIRADGSTDGDEHAQRESLTAFATSTNTLELAKLDKSDTSKVKTAKQYLLDILPTYHGSIGNTKVTKEEVYSNLPYSEEECEEGWIDTIAFTHGSHAYKPSARVLVNLWRTFSESLIIEGTSTANKLQRDDLDSIIEGSDYPQSLWEAVFDHLCVTHTKHEIQFGQTKTVQWLSEVALITTRGDEKKTTPLECLKGLLPEQWRAAATQETIANARIRLQNQGLLSTEYSKTPAENTTPSNPTITAAKRPTGSRVNWHERLKRTKK